jgi:hypothetical protein
MGHREKVTERSIPRGKILKKSIRSCLPSLALVIARLQPGAMNPRPRRVLLGLTIVLGLLSASASAQAASFTVNDPGDYALATSSSTSCVSLHQNTCTLRAAVQAADNAGGANTIVLPEGTYRLTIPAAGPSGTADPSTGDLDITDDLTITGAGPGATVIDANHVDRAFAVQGGDALSLSGLTIENGSPSANSTGGQYGGAIYSVGALSLNGVTLSDNSAPPQPGGNPGFGGAIYVEYPPGFGATYPIVLRDATFIDNAAQIGGAVFLLNSDETTVTDSAFTGNTAISSVGFGSGGAIYDEAGHGLDVESSSFSDNYSNGLGGAVDTEQNAFMTVTGSSFQSNSAGQDGGAVYVHEAGGPRPRAFTGDRFSDNSADVGGAIDLQPPFPAAASLDRDEFDHNTATSGGGAVFDGSDSASEALSSTGSSFIDNASGSEGGALYIAGGTAGWYYQPLSLTNATLSGNSAELGGGIYFSQSEPSTLTNDTIASNSALGGGGIYGTGNVVTTGTGANGVVNTTGVLNTIVAENKGGDCDTQVGASADTGHNLDSDASCFSAGSDEPGVNPLLGQPADNGGSVLTDALLAGSPAINAGINTGCPSTDPRGVPRPQGSSCDIGSFEAAAARLSLSNTAPPSALAGTPFYETVTVSDGGPGPSTATTVFDQLPAGATLYGVTSSQGSCVMTGSPANVRCQLGVLDDGTHATITLVIATNNAGTAKNTASATNDQASSASASETTSIEAPTPAGSKPKATTGGSRAAGKNQESVAGKVSTGDQPTAYFFQYGKSRAYGLITKLLRATHGTIKANGLLSHLKPGVRYHYRLVAINSRGIAHGTDRTFRIPPVRAKRPARRRSPPRHRLRGEF